MAQDELRLDELIRRARGVGLPDVISAPEAARLAGNLGSTASFTRYSAVPKDEEWFTTKWGTQATDGRIIDPGSIMGIHRALRIRTRDIVLAAATSAGIPDVWADPSEISRARLPVGWDTLTDDRWSVVRKVCIAQVDDQARAEEIARLREENAALESKVADLTRRGRKN